MRLAWVVIALVSWQTSCTRAAIAPVSITTASSPVSPCVSSQPTAAATATEAPHPWTSRVALDDVLNTRAREKRFSKRCTLGPSASLRFSLEAAPFATMPRAPFDQDALVIDEGAEDVRIVTGDPDERLVAFVARKDLHTLTTERVDLTALASDAAKDAPIRVASGVLVEQLEAEGNKRKIHLRVHDVDVFGWLPSEKVGTTYTPSAPPNTSRVDGELAWSATVVDARGNVLAKFPPPPRSNPSGATSGNYVQLVPGGPSGQQAVIWRTEITEVHGLVAAALVRAVPATSLYSDFGEALGGVGAMSDAEPISIAAGAGLFTNEGVRVGMVLHRLDSFSSFGGPYSSGELRDVRVTIRGVDFVLYARSRDLKPR